VFIALYFMTVITEDTENTKENQNIEFQLHRGDLHLRVSRIGATICGMWRGSESSDDPAAATIISTFRGAENNVGSQGEVLMPFPSRIPDGRYTFDGETYQLAFNDGTSPHAMHGFMRSALWEIAGLTDDVVTFSLAVHEGDFPGYPFSLTVDVTYTLTDDGLRCDFRAQNLGSKSAPFGAGFHPYFQVGSTVVDTDLLQVPLEQMLQNGEWVDVAGTSRDFRETRVIGDSPCDAVYTNPVRDADGMARASYFSPDGKRTVTVWMDKTFDYLVLYAGETLPPAYHRWALAIEPWTCAPNAFNYPERGLVVLKPGEVLSGSWGVVTG
jgi:aldose 1-epimerase